MIDLFANDARVNVQIAPSAFLLQGFARIAQAPLLADLQRVMAAAPLRNMVTPGGFTMSVAMTNCGDLGWVSDRKGYRYTKQDPQSSRPWPTMPTSFLALANSAASEAGFANFVPDACLINEYKVGARMGLHQDKDEQDFSQPIVSVSLGCVARFLFGGAKRTDKISKILLQHGDVIVWGGKSRLNYHGIMPLQANKHAVFGAVRFNLTFRKAS